MMTGLKKKRREKSIVFSQRDYLQTQLTRHISYSLQHFFSLGLRSQHSNTSACISDPGGTNACSPVQHYPHSPLFTGSC